MVYTWYIPGIYRISEYTWYIHVYTDHLPRRGSRCFRVKFFQVMFFRVNFFRVKFFRVKFFRVKFLPSHWTLSPGLQVKTGDRPPLHHHLFTFQASSEMLTFIASVAVQYWTT
jgi:hypothetical protein